MRGSGTGKAQAAKVCEGGGRDQRDQPATPHVASTNVDVLRSTTSRRKRPHVANTTFPATRSLSSAQRQFQTRVLTVKTESSVDGLQVMCLPLLAYTTCRVHKRPPRAASHSLTRLRLRPRPVKMPDGSWK
jgi:hypothetical protein